MELIQALISCRAISRPIEYFKLLMRVYLGAVARSNGIALNLIAQDNAMLIEKYGHQKAQTIITNMNNIFFGRINHPDTARMVSTLLGKEDREVISKNEGMNLKTKSPNMGHNFAIQERQTIRPEEVHYAQAGRVCRSDH